MGRIRKLTRLAGLALAISLAPFSLTAQAQTSRSETASSYRARGLDWLAKDRPDLALADFEIAITFDPKSAMGFYCRGVVLFDKGELDRAAADFNKAIELNQNFREAFYNRGLIRQKRGDLQGELDDYSRAITLGPRLKEVWNNRGNVRKALGDLSGAVTDFDKAIELDPNADLFIFELHLLVIFALRPGFAVESSAQRLLINHPGFEFDSQKIARQVARIFDLVDLFDGLV